MTNIINGRQIAKQLNQETKTRVDKLKEEGIIPGIVVILVGDDPASVIYTRNKQKNAEKLGMKSILRKFPKDVSQVEVLQAIHHYNDDPTIHAILIQLPLPKHLNQTELIELLLKKMWMVLIQKTLENSITMKKGTTPFLVLPAEL